MELNKQGRHGDLQLIGNKTLIARGLMFYISSSVMCILIALLDTAPDFPIIFIHLREEDPSRPTSQFGLQSPNLVCAVDLRAGGTAAAFNPLTRRFAFINNLHEPVLQGEVVSRGIVALKALETTVTAVSLAQNLRVNPFQLVTGNVDENACDLLLHGDAETSVDRVTGFFVLDNERGGGARSRQITELVKSSDFKIFKLLEILESVLLMPSPDRKTCAKSQTVLTVDAAGSVCMQHREIFLASETPTYSEWSSFST